MNDAQLVKIRDEGLALASPLQQAITALDVVDAPSYELADALLSRIRLARKRWKERVEPIIRPIKAGLDALYALNRDIDTPLANGEAAVKGKMRDYKLLEAQRAREEQMAKEREAQRLRDEAEAKERAAATARTAKMREALTEKARAIAAQAEDVETAPLSAAPVLVERSTTRIVRKPTVTDVQAFARGIGAGLIPAECVAVVNKMLVDCYRQDPGTVAQWPGVVIVEDVQIVGR